jgi:hypothetical protein
VRNIDERRGRTIGGIERLLHLLRDVHELGAAVGLESDLLHGSAYPRQMQLKTKRNRIQDAGQGGAAESAL